MNFSIEEIKATLDKNGTYDGQNFPEIIARNNKKVIKTNHFLCFLVQLRLKITKLTPIFVRLKATARIKTMTCRNPYPPFKYQV